MPDDKEWLEEILDEASADVRTWPSWLKDKHEGKEEKNDQRCDSNNQVGEPREACAKPRQQFD